MRKEVIWAIVAGIALGLVVAFGVWRINSTVTTKKNIVEVEQTPTPTPQGPTEFKVVIDKPNQNDVFTENQVNVSGVTKPNLWVTLSSESGDYIIQADQTGAFVQTIPLASGINQIKVTAIDEAGKQATAGVNVVYSSAFQLRPSATPPATTGATESSEIRQKVAQDLVNTLSVPKAYVGVVTDITEASIEVKAATGDIQQISISETGTTVFNMVGSNNKQVKPTDIAIGDFTISMGYIGTNSVLGAQRILITNPTAETKVNVTLAKIISNSKKGLGISNIADGKEDSIQPDTKTAIQTYNEGKTTSSKLTAIVPDDKIIFFTTTDSKGTSTVRSIFIIPQN